VEGFEVSTKEERVLLGVQDPLVYPLETVKAKDWTKTELVVPNPGE
jgi:hypothetical protein